MIFLLIGSVCATDIDDGVISASDNDEIVNEENDLNVLSTNTEDTEMASASDVDEIVDAEDDLDVLGDDTSTYSELSNEIGSGGDIELQHKYYTYDSGSTISISTPGVINGNGAVIDMAGSNIRAFYVSASGVTIKDLTIQNANYDGSGGAIYFSSSASSCTVENCNFTDNTASVYGGAVYFLNNGEVTNCNFTGNKATDGNGGAVYFLNNGEVTNCNFTNNTASVNGGAVYFLENGEVTNCNFTNNTASEYGGAVYFQNNGEVTNCNFTNNTASVNGGAVYFQKNGEVTNCNFVRNSASRGGGIFSNGWYTSADTCIFKTDSDKNNVNVVNFPPTLNVDDFTTVFNSGEKIAFDLKTNINSLRVTNGNISISVYCNNDTWVGDYSCLSGEEWAVELPVGSYYAIYNTEYAGFEAINRTIKIMPDYQLYANVTPLTSNNLTVNITAKSNIPNDVIEGKLLFILPNGDEISANYCADGTWWAVYTFDDYGDYEVKASYTGYDGVVINNATITVKKLKSSIVASSIATTYNVDKDLVITLKDADGNPLSGLTVAVDLNGAKNYTTDKNGQVKVAVGKLVPKTYTAKISFAGDDKYSGSEATAKVTVKKATPNLTASAKSYKFEDKTKTYTVTLKDNKGNVLKNKKVTLKINGKTYSAKTNSKGVATFKLSKLTKKGTYTAVITYAGDKYYNKATKNAKLTVKAPAWKTVSKGSKDKATVKKIQKALKNNGYYLTYKGHYLKIDGIYHDCTVRSVKQFQKAKGLKVTGKVDEKTAKKLKLI